jgi:hypothetical protein
MRLINPKKMAVAAQFHRIRTLEFIIYALVYLGSVALFVSAFVKPEMLNFLGADIRSEVYWMLLRILWAASLPAVLIFSYNANRRGDRKDFWYRHVAINFPVNVILFLVYLFFDIILSSIYYLHLSDIPTSIPYGYANFATDLAVVILYIFLNWKYMKLASEK